MSNVDTEIIKSKKFSNLPKMYDKHWNRYTLEINKTKLTTVRLSPELKTWYDQTSQPSSSIMFIAFKISNFFAALQM